MTEQARLLAVERVGAEPGPTTETFVLVHGFGASRYSWRHWMPRLARRGRVLAVDLKGFGDAPKPDDEGYGPLDQVALVRELIEEENPARLTLIGHSFGGGVALLTALAMAEAEDPRLHRLVSVAGIAYRQRLPPFVTFAQYPQLSRWGLRVLGPERVIRWAMKAIVYDRSSVDDDQVTAYASPLRAEEGVRAAMDAARRIIPPNLDSLTPRYPTIQVPALLLWGSHDRVIPITIAKQLATALPNARLEVLEECGHIPHEERPDASWAVLEDFLNRT